ncbi:hypothetical protein BH11PAT1_BH11PAT1_0310 [soil metagenome]
MKKYHKQATLPNRKDLAFSLTKMSLWFSLGAFLGLFFLTSFLYIFYQNSYKNTVYPGVFVDGIDFSGKTKEEVKNYFLQKNDALSDISFTFATPDKTATASAKELAIGYDDTLLATQAYSIGRSGNIFSDTNLLWQAYTSGVMLPPAYKIQEDTLKTVMEPVSQAVNKDPQNALFSFENGRVTAFRPAINGQAVNMSGLKKALLAQTMQAIATHQTSTIIVLVPLQITEPEISNEEANNLGIKELVGRGTSLFAGSIENRIYNLTLATSRLNGLLIKPNETFSFVKAVGDISGLSGYKQAYVIQNGKTVLGDGGGVCQVSTTLFRAVLNAGLPVVERNPHAYRVHYYEEDLGPGIDAAIYTPSVDLKFKNDTGHYLLIQSFVNPGDLQLTFELYGTTDGKVTEIGKPIITSQSPAPEPVYQDDPTLPKGVTKQVDFAASGAKVYFTRTVKKNGKTLIDEKFYSTYRPWQAIFLRGTKEG